MAHSTPQRPPTDIGEWTNHYNRAGCPVTHAQDDTGRELYLVHDEDGVLIDFRPARTEGDARPHGRTRK